MYRPANVEPASVPIDTGSMINPEFVADRPVAYCRNSGKSNGPAPSSRPAPIEMSIVLRNSGLRNRCGGMIAASVRDSQASRPTSRIALAANNPTIVTEPQPYERPPHWSASRSVVVVPAMSTNPTASNRRDAPWFDPAGARCATRIAPAQSGAFTRKAHRHPTLSTIHPPTVGPSTVAVVNAAISRAT